MNAALAEIDYVEHDDSPEEPPPRAVEPDRRRHNHMGPETRAVDARLSAWGRWASGDGTGVGWPAQTILGRMIEFGPMGASQPGRPPTTMPEEIAAVDAAVARLGAVDQGVIRAYYLTAEPVPETLWKRCRGIRSLANFRAVLRRARWRVAGFLDGWYHKKNLMIISTRAIPGNVDS